MACAHLNELRAVEPSTVEGCEDCLAMDGTWVHLRLCMDCGHVGCCDSSPNRHATAHTQGSGHLVVQSFEPGERWAWCYEDEGILEDVGPELDRHHR